VSPAPRPQAWQGFKPAFKATELGLCFSINTGAAAFYQQQRSGEPASVLDVMVQVEPAGPSLVGHPGPIPSLGWAGLRTLGSGQLHPTRSFLRVSLRWSRLPGLCRLPAAALKRKWVVGTAARHSHMLASKAGVHGCRPSSGRPGCGPTTTSPPCAPAPAGPRRSACPRARASSTGWWLGRKARASCAGCSAAARWAALLRRRWGSCSRCAQPALPALRSAG
jgi:hypothetical protein